jgi:HK97 family phage portal protein
MIKEADGYGGATALWNAPWRQVSVLSSKDAPIVGYRVMNGASALTFAQADVVHFGEGDPDAPIAPSPLEPLEWTIALADAMARHLTAYFQNSARPSGVLKFEQMPDDDELANIREQIQQLYSGAENAGKPLLTSGEWSPMTTGSSYSDLIELAHASREEVAAAYGIPPPVMGILDNAIKSSVKELREQYLRDVLAVHGSMISDELQTQLVDPNPSWGGLTVGFDFTARLMPDLEAFAIAVKGLQSVYTMNELRRMAGLPDLAFEWADQPWMVPGSLPANLAPQGATVSRDDVPVAEPAEVAQARQRAMIELTTALIALAAREQPAITVQAQPARSQRIERDGQGNMIRIVEEE